MKTGISGVMLAARAALALQLAVSVLALAVPALAQSPLDQAYSLEQQGKLKEAREQYHAAAEQLGTSGNQADQATALSRAGNIAINLGDYAGAIQDAEHALEIRQRLHQTAGPSFDLNTIGNAYRYLGNFPSALENYQKALVYDRQQGDSAGEVFHLNNIGTVYYLQGGYTTALVNYQNALNTVNANKGQSWYAWGHKLTTTNLATVYQKLGMEERALELYQEIAGKPQAMPPEEYAQVMVNEGVLYRHLGDPIKALEMYQAAQALFRSARHSDGEISALRSIGIAKTMDLGDLRGALKAFSAALELSEKSSDSRNIVLNNLYMGEVLRRLRRYEDAASHLKAALEKAQKMGLVEEQWKALYALGQIAEHNGDTKAALEDYRQAIAIIESIRAGLSTISLRIDFLADKRDVYDSLIAFELQQPSPSAGELFRWMEHSRARTLMDRLAARTVHGETTLPMVQAHLPADTVLVEFWVGKQNSMAVWITPSASGIVRYPPTDDIGRGAKNFLAALQAPGNGWEGISRDLGAKILAGIPLNRHLIVVPDGPLNFPFEVLRVPGSEKLLIEQCDLSYLPSAGLLTTPPPRGPRWRFPWSRELVALGDPPLTSTDALAEKEHWQPLPASADEVRGIAKILPGRAEIHLGTDARKVYLLGHRLEGLPLLHLSTHALVDPEHPDRSRILLAAETPGAFDYLFQKEVNNLDLNHVSLVTLSACDTAQGKVIAGEGVQAFSQAFLAAGASATVTSMWKVADGPTADFMMQFYDSLKRGMPKAAALRAAQLRFLHSNSGLASPRYWAAFVLTGDGWQPATPVIPWSVVLFVLAGALAGLGLVLWRILATRAG